MRKPYLEWALAPEGYDGPIMVDEDFFSDIDTYLDNCASNEYEDPYSREPVICEPVLFPRFDIAEWFQENTMECDDDGVIDYSWLAPVQEHLDKATDEANVAGTRFWEAINQRPQIDLAEYAKYLAVYSAPAPLG